MNESAKSIRKVIIPLTWAATIVSAIGYGIYALVINSPAPSQHGGEAVSVSLFPAILTVLAIIVGGFFATVLWMVLADLIDNLSVIADNTTAMADVLYKSSYNNDELRVESLKKKQRELVQKFRQNDLDYSEKAAIYNEIEKIEAEIKRLQRS
ncbi:MAG: hypothetical protein II779_09605 [Clostridia bacterium]|nr:hypothetical protein [Clostridia bacterium]